MRYDSARRMDGATANGGDMQQSIADDVEPVQLGSSGTTGNQSLADNQFGTGDPRRYIVRSIHQMQHRMVLTLHDTGPLPVAELLPPAPLASLLRGERATLCADHRQIVRVHSARLRRLE